MAPHSSEYYVDLKLKSLRYYELTEETSEHMNTWILHMKHIVLCGYNNQFKLPSYCKPTQLHVIYSVPCADLVYTALMKSQ